MQPFNFYIRWVKVKVLKIWCLNLTSKNIFIFVISILVRFEKLKNKIYFVGCTFFPGLSVNYTCPVGATIIWPITSKLVSSACCENFCRFTFLELIINIFRRTIFFLLASMKPFMSIPFFFLSFFLFSFLFFLSFLPSFLFVS